MTIEGGREGALAVDTPYYDEQKTNYREHVIVRTSARRYPRNVAYNLGIITTCQGN